MSRRRYSPSRNPSPPPDRKMSHEQRTLRHGYSKDRRWLTLLFRSSFVRFSCREKFWRSKMALSRFSPYRKPGRNMSDREGIVNRVSCPSVLTTVTPFDGLENSECKSKTWL